MKRRFSFFLHFSLLPRRLFKPKLILFLPMCLLLISIPISQAITSFFYPLIHSFFSLGNPLFVRFSPQAPRFPPHSSHLWRPSFRTASAFHSFSDPLIFSPSPSFLPLLLLCININFLPEVPIHFFFLLSQILPRQLSIILNLGVYEDDDDSNGVDNVQP